MKIVIAKFSAWNYEEYKTSEHPEYVAIRNIVSKHPQHKFVLIGEGQESGYFERNGIQFYNIKSKTKTDYLFSFLLKLELALLLRPSVIVAMGTFNTIPFGLSSTITRSRLIPVVTGEIGYGTRSLPKPFRGILSHLFRAALRRSHTILSLSKSIQRELVTEYGINPKDTFVYKYRISEKFNPNVPKSLKSSLNPDGPIVLTLCRVSREKGLENLITASRDIAKRVPKVKIIIKGSSRDQRYREELIQLVQENGLDNHVEFLEFSPYSEIPKFLAASDVFVLPSLSEGLGLVILEAMATGVPVVASRVGGILDILKNEYNGLSVIPGRPDALAEAVLRLLSDNGLRKRLIKNGLATVRRAETDDIEKLLTELVFRESRRTRGIMHSS